MRSLRAAWRMLRALGHALGGLWIIVFVFPRLTLGQREDRVQAWAARMLRLLGVALEVHGQPAPGPVLRVANHISWLDILVLHAGGHCRFVSKSEVHRWPLIGRLAAGAGTLFVERASRRDAMRVVHHMAESLRAGEVLAVFPEGTTSDGSRLLPFHANLLQAAIAAAAPIQPVALGYLDAASRQPTLAASYTGDDTLLASLWRVLTAPPVLAVVRYGPPQSAAGRDRRRWAAELRQDLQRLRASGSAPRPCGA